MYLLSFFLWNLGSIVYKLCWQNSVKHEKSVSLVNNSQPKLSPIQTLTFYQANITLNMFKSLVSFVELKNLNVELTSVHIWMNCNRVKATQIIWLGSIEPVQTWWFWIRNLKKKTWKRAWWSQIRVHMFS